MEDRELALLVEGSEARAYASLLNAAPAQLRDRYGLRAQWLGTVVSVHAESVTTSLNMNRIIGLGIAEPANESMVDQLASAYQRRGAAFAIELSPRANPASIPDWLRKRRLRKGVSTALQFRSAAPLHFDVPGVTVMAAAASQREIVAEICCTVFRMPAPVHALIAATAGHAGWRQWLVYCDGAPIAAALSYAEDGVAWLGWDATLPEGRGKGAQSALIARRVNEAALAGCRYVTTETAVHTSAVQDPSFRNYQRLGFTLAYERPTYIALQRTPAPRDASAGTA